MDSPALPSDDEMDIFLSGSESEGKRKRGATRLPHLAKENNPKQKQIEYNYKNQAIGAHRVELGSYIGMEVKRSLSLRYPGEWKEVPESEKDKLWEDITIHYEIHESFKKQTIAACGHSMRDWKCRLGENYIYPFEGNKKKLKKIPDAYPSIKQDDWDRFVKHRLSPEFKKKREKYIELRKKNKYPHRMGRTGYAGLEEKLIKDGTCSSDEPIDRSFLWKKARENKNGDFEGNDLQSVVDKIDDYSKQINEGSISVVGRKDALTLALGTPEHDGRVRGAGKDVTPTNFFHKSPRPRSTSKAQDAEIQALQKQVHEQQLNLEKQKLDFEKEKLNWKKEMDERLDARLEEIQKGLKLQVSKETSRSLPSLPSGKATVRSSAGSRHQSDSHPSEPCKLAVNSPSKIIALGTVFPGQNMIHGVLLPKTYVKVSVEVVFDSSAILPRPTKEVKFVEDAKGSFVGWPKHLVLPNTNNEEESSGLDSFEQFYKDAEEVMIDGATIGIEYERNVFDQYEDCRLTLFLEDVDYLCHCKWLSGNNMMIYILHLYEKMSEDDRKNTYGFLNPMSICNALKDEEARFVTNVKEKMYKAQQRYIFIPFNTGNHWVLMVFIKETMEVHYFNPMKNGCSYGLYKRMTSASAYLRELDKKKRKTLTWIKKKNIPTQPGSWECGYYVMKYMKDIVELNVDIASPNDMKSVFGLKAHYNQSDIDEVRQECIDYINPYLLP